MTRRWRTGFSALVALSLAFVLTTGVAWAYWSPGSTPGGSGAAGAATVEQGATPTASSAGSTVTVSWAASTLSTGQAVTGYRIARYDASTGAVQPVSSTCSGTVTATSCAEGNVPAGSWKYTVTPVVASNWRGGESPRSSTVTIGTTAPTVTINQAAGQADPTSGSPVAYAVVFSQPVTGFTTGDVALAGTTGGTKVGTVTGSGTTYSVAVTGMTGDGTIVATVPAGRAQDLAGFDNAPSTSTDNTVTYDDPTPPTVTINQAAAQADPTNASTVNHTVVFSEPVTGFATGDVTLAGTTGGTKVGTVTGSGTTYNVAVTGATGNGTIIATVAAGRATDLGGNANTASTSTDNTVTRDTTAPTVTINQAAGQASTTSASPVNFTVVFSEPVTGFTGTDVTLTAGTAGATTATVTGSGPTYTVGVSGMTRTGTVRATIGAGTAQDLAGNNNAASTSTDNSVNYEDTTAPTVTINQAAGQADPTSASPVGYTVVFSEPVTGFTGNDLTYTGTAGATTATVSGSGSTYTVNVSGMTQTGTVRPTIASGRAQDVSGNNNAASTSTDNTVQYDDTVAPTVTINQASGQADPSNASTVNYTVVFNETVTGFATGDVTLGGTTGGTKVGTVTGSGKTYNVAVTGMTGNGTIVATVPAATATDASGSANAASTSTDNTVTRDATAPAVTINQAAAQADPTNASPVTFTVVFSEPVTGFTSSDITITGTAGGTKSATVSGSGPTYNVAISGATGSGTIVATIAAGRAADVAQNGNTASTSTDNTVTRDGTAPTVTINQATGQADPTSGSTVSYTVVFSEPVTGFATGDVTVGGTAGGTKTATVSGSGPTYDVAVTGMTSDGTVVATIASGRAIDAVGNGNTASTSTDNTVTRDTTAPTVTINQAAGQADPTSASPVNYTVVFSQPVTGFTTGDVTITGTAGGTKTGTVTGSGATYTVAVTGMTGDGTVIASLPTGVAQDLAGNANVASTSTDNTVSYTFVP